MKFSDGVKAILGDDTVFYSLLVLLVGVTAFGLGKHSVSVPEAETQSAGVSMSVVEPVAASAATGQVVASKNGSKYHLPWCPGASQMKEENKVWFDTIEAAEAAGYTPAANCKGL